jgi:hypothetical protein
LPPSCPSHCTLGAIFTSKEIDKVGGGFITARSGYNQPDKAYPRRCWGCGVTETLDLFNGVTAKMIRKKMDAI